MSYKDKYVKLYSAYKTTSNKRLYVDSTKETINQLFIENPSSKLVRINDSEEEKWVWIVEDTKNPYKKKIIMPPDESLEAGWIIYWNNEPWLCINVDKSNSEIYESGYIEKCNTELKWVDDEGVVRSYPCILIYGTKANFGTYSDKIMTIPDNRRQVVVQKNEHTMKLKTDDRFIFGNAAFQVIDYDFISDEGLVNLNLKGVQIIEASDNVELGIANYYDRVAKYELNILNGDNVSIEKTQTLKLIVEIKKNGVLIDPSEVEFDISDPSIATVNEDGLITPHNSGSVEVFVYYKNLKKSIKINIVENVVYNYTVELKGETFVYKNSTYNYSAVFKNNGIVYDDSAHFYITDIDGASKSDIAIIESQDSVTNTCRIRTANKTGSFLLHVQNPSKLVKATLKIQVKTLL